MRRLIDALLIAVICISAAGAGYYAAPSNEDAAVFDLGLIECTFAQEFLMGYYVGQGDNWLNASQEARNLTEEKTGDECQFTVWNLTARQAEQEAECSACGETARLAPDGVSFADHVCQAEPQANLADERDLNGDLVCRVCRLALAGDDSGICPSCVKARLNKEVQHDVSVSVDSPNETAHAVDCICGWAAGPFAFDLEAERAGEEHLRRALDVAERQAADPGQADQQPRESVQ